MLEIFLTPKSLGRPQIGGPRQNRRQKVFCRGALRLCGGRDI